MCDWLEREKLLDTTYIILVSDHGLEASQPGGQIDLLAYVREVLKRNATGAVQQDQPKDHRTVFFSHYDTVIVANVLFGHHQFRRGITTVRPQAFFVEIQPAAAFEFKTR